ncbi:hypothetical protein ACIBJE_31190 [Micromonospora sp. NPDC050187]|uniref:hypothetical protein n=1 Tax=Micromonospora sp. NPDC050187 TaxID=3364277 RepID=UPI00378B0980
MRPDTAPATPEPAGHRGVDWPKGGGDPFDPRLPWPGWLYWAHGQPSRVFPADQLPPGDELLRAMPMGYTTLTLLERVALVSRGRRLKEWPPGERRSVGGPFQPYQLILPPSGSAAHLMLGATWPERFAVRDGEQLSVRTGGTVLVCRVLDHQNWH